MLDSKIIQAFFFLLRAGLWEKENVPASFPPLSDQEWKQLFDLSIQQTVDGIVYYGVQKLRDEWLPPRSLHVRWTIRINQLEQLHTKMNKTITEQAILFKVHKIDAVLLKGQGLAQYYHQPTSRSCGDIDWCFNGKQDFDRANSVIKNSMISLTSQAGSSCFYFWEGVETEHHRHIFDIHNPLKKAYLRKLTDRYPIEKKVRFNGEVVLTLSPILNMLQVNSHILKHMLSFGIGIRQLCDAARLYFNEAKNIDGTQLLNIYRALGILPWVHLLHQLLHDFLGLPKENLPIQLDRSNNANWMMEEILYAGNFGFYDNRFGTSDQSGLKRSKRRQRLLRNMKNYLPYATPEVIWFPIVHFLSGLKK